MNSTFLKDKQKYKVALRNQLQRELIMVDGEIRILNELIKKFEEEEPKTTEEKVV